MSKSQQVTAEEFLARRHELPEGGRWTELVAGEVTSLQPPDEGHGTVVLNLSKALAGYLHSVGPQPTGCACYDLGLVTGRGPDTVRFPPLSFFDDAGPFGRMDEVLTEDRPALVFEIASTNDRRREMRARVEEWLSWGVRVVWVADPVEREFYVHVAGGATRQLGEDETLAGAPAMPGFEVPVAELFAEPAWYR